MNKEKKITIGLLAHVDAGKTTLSESLLYQAKALKNLGRVDHQNSFLDYDSQERKRGITIYLKQASLKWNNCLITILDTPGHLDFSSEMERTLQVLDLAIIVINGLDGVQSHTKTIFKLLKELKVPTFIFVNKMDIAHFDQSYYLKDLQKNLDQNCHDFSDLKQNLEEIALCDDEMLQYYLEKGNLDNVLLQKAIYLQKIIPVFFGSALKQIGINYLLDQITNLTLENNYPNSFGAKVFKITRDMQNNRLTHLKITGGSLKVKEVLENGEKIDQIRIYNGQNYQTVTEAFAGDICTLKGINNIMIGQGLGFENNFSSKTTSYLIYQLIVKDKIDNFSVLNKLKQLEEEDPQLHFIYQKDKDQILVHLMGEIQTEIIKNTLKERFDLNVEFGAGQITYQETINNTVEGVGHFEPLKHYAEVHLLLEKGERGSGINISSNLSTDELKSQWQKQIIYYLETKEHLGVLTNSSLTDLKITLVAGKASEKHTDSQDFKEASYRALRQGLLKAENILLEPYYRFTLLIEHNYLSKALYDLENMNAIFSIEQANSDQSLIKGTCPIRKMQNYHLALASYTKSKAKLECQFDSFQPCLEQEEIVSSFNYDPYKDLNNPAYSIFCKQGTGFIVQPDEVENYMHLPYYYDPKATSKATYKRNNISDEELKQVLARTYKSKDRINQKPKAEKDKQPVLHQTTKINKPKCLIVDGYNIIFAFQELKQLAQDNIDAARVKLINMLNNYYGYYQNLIILVFDAYKTNESTQKISKDGNIYVIYTKKAETADSYIEKSVHSLAKDFDISVATSDNMIQLVILSQNALRISARELETLITTTHNSHMEQLKLENLKNIHIQQKIKK